MKRAFDRGAIASRRLLFILAGLGIVAAIALGAKSLPDFRKRDDSLANSPTFSVEKGPLVISVAETGTIKPREQLILKSELEGQATILYLVEEGTQVKKGDLLVELDATALIDERVEDQIKVQNAEATYVSARENLEVVKNQALADVEKAELDFDFAGQDLKKYLDGEYPNLLKEAETKITLAREELLQAEEALKWSKILFDEKYLAQSDLQRDELTAKKAELNVELAVQELGLLKDFTHKRQHAELASLVRQAELALDRIKRKAAAGVVQAEAELKAADAEYKQESDKLAKLEKQIEKAEIYAPMDGMVVYATSARGNWRGNDEPLQEGQSVRERQELIYLPTTSSFNAEIRVHEASLEKVHSGLPARVTVDALPGKTYRGKVAFIAPLPDAQSAWMNPDLKVYRTVIEIQGGGLELRNGMSCRAEVVVETHSDAIYVPVQAVMRIGGKPSVFVRDGNDFVARPIEVGLDNNSMVHVLAGLQPDERVLLTPPLAAASDQGASDEPVAAEVAPASTQSTPATTPAAESAAPATPVVAADPAAAAAPPAEADSGEPPRRRRDAEGAESAGENRGERSRNMTPEQRAAWQERLRNMSPEERAAMRERRRQRSDSGAGEP